MKRIYLDHAATTPLDPRVLEAMQPWLSAVGNPSSGHQEGRRAKEAIDIAREIVAESLDCLFGEVCFVSSGTEAANLALLGSALGTTSSRRKILFGASEHHCVLHVAPLLERLGFEVVEIPCDREARISAESLAVLLDDETLSVAVMHANNELGTLNDISSLVRLAHQAGAAFFCDAVQTVGQLPVTMSGMDYLSFSAHKFNGPKGIGALCVQAGAPMEAVIRGGGQEREVRAGTENVAGIVGLGEALRIAGLEMRERQTRKAIARAAFVDKLKTDLPEARFSTPELPELKGHVHLRIPGIRAENILIALDRAGISASSGAACSSGSIEPSHVLLACGYSQSEAEGGLRFTFGHENTPAEGVLAAESLTREARRILSRQ